MKNLKELYTDKWVKHADKLIAVRAKYEMKLWEQILGAAFKIENPSRKFDIENCGEYTKLYIKEYRRKLHRYTGKYGKNILLGIELEYDLHEDGTLYRYQNRTRAQALFFVSRQ